jgi:fatty-acyl-CoA synthase
MNNVGELISRVHSQAKPIDRDRTALIFKDQRMTYWELNLRTNKVANSLAELGVKKGDRVACLLYNCVEYWEIFFACAKLGAILVPLNFRLAAPELEFAINDSDPKVLIFGDSFKETVRGLVKKIAGVKYYIGLAADDATLENFDKDPHNRNYKDLLNGDDGEPGVNVGFEDDLFVMYTSGTTGRPKGAIWTHGNALWFSVSQIVSFGFTNSDVTLLVGPLYHVGALQDISMPTFHLGGTCVMLQSKGFDAHEVLQLIAKERITKTLLFPVMLYDILSLPDLDQYDLSSLKLIITGGEVVPVTTIETLQERLPQTDLLQGYGLTEGTAIATICPPEYAKKKIGSAGKPLLNVDIRIADDEGNILGPGKTGEVLVKSPSVSKGYWNRPKANEATFVDGWCHTGDLGQLDEDGFLYIEGRKKDMIISGAENIYPAEIEDVLFQHPSVHEAAVIGIPDPRWGEAVMAIIVKRPGRDLTKAEIIDFCRDRLAGYKKPRYVAFVDSLPRTPSQKVQKFVLRERFRHTGERNRHKTEKIQKEKEKE